MIGAIGAGAEVSTLKKKEESRDHHKVGPPFTMAKLVHITPITMVYGTYNYSIHGVYKPTYNWGAPNCTCLLVLSFVGVSHFLH